MRTWEDAKVMELNINETATSADEVAEEAIFWGDDPFAKPGKPGNQGPSCGGNNNSNAGSNSGSNAGSNAGSGSDSSDSFVDSLS
jgi:hypothetical protein